MNLPLIDQGRKIVVDPLPATGLATSWEQRRVRLYLGLIVGDIGMLTIAFLIAGFIYIGRKTGMYSVLLPLQLLIPIYLTIALHNDTYSLASLRDWRQAAVRAFVALAISAALLNFFAFFAKINAEFSRVGVLIGLALSAMMITALRYVAINRIRRRWGPNPLNVLVIDDGGPPFKLDHCYHIRAADVGLQPSLDDPHALDLLARYVRNMDRVIVNCPPDRRVPWAMVLKGCGVHGEVQSNYMREIGALGIVRHEEIGVTTVLVSTGPLGLRSRAVKRIVDMGVSLASLVVVLPILVLAAAAIKLEDGGPILFKQKRVGRRNQLFPIYKLRTMKVERSDGDGNRSASKNDDRITHVGRFLRRTSIDELPQLFNVLKGDMSLVGPRPHAIGSLAGDKLFWEVDQRYWQRHSLRPGLTGLAQIRGFRGATDQESDLSSRLQADLEYITGWTIWRDLRILAATTRVLVHDRAF